MLFQHIISIYIIYVKKTKVKELIMLYINVYIDLKATGGIIISDNVNYEITDMYKEILL